jgi:hypothetical protein
MKATVAYLLFIFNLFVPLAVAIPPPEDVPEEILRTEIILYGRSPITGKPLTASEYVKLQEQIAQSNFSSPINPEIRELIFLLRLRKLFNDIIPF